jgi:hypothetical protein
LKNARVALLEFKPAMRQAVFVSEVESKGDDWNRNLVDQHRKALNEVRHFRG